MALKRAGGLDLRVAAKGPNVQLPPSLAAVATPVVAELRARASNAQVCWQTTFGESDVTNLSTRLRAKH